MKENQHIEYKQSWRDEYLRWICGFANAEGGTLVIGRNDVEFSFPENTQDRLGEAPVETPVQTRGKIIRLLAQHPEMTLAEIAAAIGKSVRAVERAGAKLVQEGRIRHVGPTKAGRWEILK